MGSPRVPRTPSQPEGVRSTAQDTPSGEHSRSGAKHREHTSRTSSPSGDVRKSDAMASEARKQRAQSPATIAQKAAAAAAAAATAQAAPPGDKGEGDSNDAVFVRGSRSRFCLTSNSLSSSFCEQTKTAWIGSEH